MDRRQFKGTSVFTVYDQMIRMEIAQLREYITEISEDLLRKQSNLTDNFNAASEAMPEDAEYSVADILSDEIHRYFKKFPAYTYNSMLLVIYGLFENWMKRLCELDARKNLSKIQIDDLHGNGYIEKSHKYLTLVAGLEIPKDTEAWKEITSIQKLRNCISHNDASIAKPGKPIKNQELYQWIKKQPAIELNENNGDFYINDSVFLLEALDLIYEFIKPIIGKLRSRKVVARNTTMPYNNAEWGIEKSKALLKGLISGLEDLDQFAIRKDRHAKKDTIINLQGLFVEMAVDLTKLYSFFTDGDWEVKDAKIITEKRLVGLDELAKIYETGH